MKLILDLWPGSPVTTAITEQSSSAVYWPSLATQGPVLVKVRSTCVYSSDLINSQLELNEN